jgi:hypothetical protein
MDARFDETDWPLVVVRWRGVPDEEEMTSFLACMDNWLTRGERFALLIDSTHGAGLAPEQRAQLVGHMKRQAQLSAKYLIQAVVLSSLVQRSLFYAVKLLFPPPFPSKVFAEEDAAREWLTSMLATSRNASGM